MLARLAPLQEVSWSPFKKRGLYLSIKREDLLGDNLGGNKVYKLYGHLQLAKQTFASSLRLASFGGAWSNHLYALAAAAQQLGVPALALVRGEPGGTPSAMLRDVMAMGMQIEYLSRAEYREKEGEAGKFLKNRMDLHFGKHYWIPEGGGGLEGARHYWTLREAILELSANVDKPLDVLAHACGTGTSLAGLLGGARRNLTVLGFAVLKAGESIENEIGELLPRLGGTQAHWELNKAGHCGGYAKLPEYLIEFIHDFELETGVPLDPVYTAKLMYGLKCMAETGKWKTGTHIVAVHSGGLQGRRGWSCFQTQNSPNSE
jgi:1-aminocyclopropane-1-carboxylate deaminase